MSTTYKVGDRVKGEMNPGETFEGTIVYINPFATAGVLLGWKVGEKPMYNAWDVYSSGLDAGHMPPGYVYGYWIVPRFLTGVLSSAASTTSATSGMKCARCGEYNSYAQPNQPDNTYKCYPCRQPH